MTPFDPELNELPEVIPSPVADDLESLGENISDGAVSEITSPLNADTNIVSNGSEDNIFEDSQFQDNNIFYEEDESESLGHGGYMQQGIIPPDYLSDIEEENLLQYDSDISSLSGASAGLGLVGSNIHLNNILEPETDMGNLYDGIPISASVEAGTIAQNLQEPCEDIKAVHTITFSEIVSLVLHDLAVKYSGQREYVAAQRQLHAITGNRVQDYRTARKHVTSMTGISAVMYDCCPQSCMSFAMYGSDCTECLECKHPRWKDPVRKTNPFAQHSYIPVARRLQLWWSNSNRAQKMIEYRKLAEQDRISGKRSDFWSGDLFQDLKAKGLFRKETDMAFVLSSDGVKVFKSRRAFYVWPLILVCLNLPPEERYKRRNIFVVGFVPGPNNPKDMDSFIWPLVNEFLKLETGIDTWNGYREHDFQLCAYITIVTGDMPGRAKLQGFRGSRAQRYCPYCYCKAVNLRGIPYCPFKLPHDVPLDHECVGRNDHNPLNLDLRNDQDTRTTARNIVMVGGAKGDALGKLYGIKDVAILSKLCSIDMVRSFPPDSMHLWWENIIPDMMKHWRGRFDTLDHTRDPSDTLEQSENDEGIDLESSESKKNGDSNYDEQRPIKRKRIALSTPIHAGQSQTGHLKPSRKSPKFVATNDPWNIPPSEWDKIGRDMAASNKSVPAAFGEAIRDIWDHCHHLKAAEWKQAGLVLLPIYLKDLSVAISVSYPSFLLIHLV
jgi:hypothetical protein